MSLLLLFNQTSAWTATCSDGVSLIDSNSNTISPLFSDSITVSELLSSLSTYNRTLSDSLTLSDLISNGLVRTLTDALTLSDSDYRLSLIKNLAETFTLSDQFNRLSTYTKSISDTVSLSDVAVKNIFRRLTDSIAAGDSLTHQWIILRSIADNLSTSDNRSSGRLGKLLSDAITLADVPWFRKLLSDGITLSDNITKAIGAQQKELIFFTGPNGNRFKRWTGSEWKTVDVITAFRNTN